MARIDNLVNFLTDIAKAIKNKKGNQTPIKAQDFDIEIMNLPSGGGAISGTINLTSPSNRIEIPNPTGQLNISVLVWHTNPTYGVNGCIGFNLISHFMNLNLSAYPEIWTDGIVYTCFETRTNLANYASCYTNNSSVWTTVGGGIFSDKIIGSVRNINYLFEAGEYKYVILKG